MTTDFSKGKVWKNIVGQAVPLTLAQLVQLLYNVVDRIYIGHLPGEGNMALTGVGLTFPVITLIAAFTALFGSGGTPLFSMARGEKNREKAEKILGTSFFLLLVSSVILMILLYFTMKPVLFLFGASETSYYYGALYLRIYLIGTVFSMVSTGLNGYINAQGFPGTGMLTTVIGAVLNLVLDPLFIFALHMGVAGAAVATVISQGVSMTWVLMFFRSEKALERIKREYVVFRKEIASKIVGLGAAGFIMQGTNAVVQIVCNATLQQYGGDLYVGIMTILNSVREVLSLTVSGIASGAQPVLGFNYGARKYHRVKQGIRFSVLLGFTYTILAWGVVMLIPRPILSVFTWDSQILHQGQDALKIYFFGFCFMAFQFGGQSVFQALGYAKHAIFFSLLRKVMIVVPLTILLPAIGFGVNGVFLAEPISNVIGGLASFITMWYTIYRKLDTKKGLENE